MKVKSNKQDEALLQQPTTTIDIALPQGSHQCSGYRLERHLPTWPSVLLVALFTLTFLAIYKGEEHLKQLLDVNFTVAVTLNVSEAFH